MQIIPLMQDPLATGLQQMMAGYMQGKAADRQKSMQHSDLLKSMVYQNQLQKYGQLSPEQQQPMIERQGIIDRYSGINPGAAFRPSGVPQIPQYQTQKYRDNLAMQAMLQGNKGYQLQQENVQSGIDLNRAKEFALRNPTPPVVGYDMLDIPGVGLRNVPKGTDLSNFPPGTSKASTSSVNIDLGKDEGVTKPTRTKMEAEVFDSVTLANDLRSLEGQLDPAFLELKNKLGAKVFAQVGKVEQLRKLYPDETQEFYTNISSFSALAEQMFNGYRHKITGAQAGIPELKFLRKSFPTSDDSAAVFDGKTRIAEDYFRTRARLLNQTLIDEPGEGRNELSALIDREDVDRQAARILAKDIQSGKYGEEVTADILSDNEFKSGKQIVGTGPLKRSQPGTQLKPPQSLTDAEAIKELKKQGWTGKRISDALKGF